MARSKTVRAPTTASLPNDLRIPSSTPSLAKSLSRLSRQALLDLVFFWLEDCNIASFLPYLQSDEDGQDNDEALPYPAGETIQEVRQVYEDLQERKGGKREVLERILEGDWRHGITMRQLAMADLRYMNDHPASLRWTALELSRIDTPRKTSKQLPPSDWSSSVPRMQAATFVRNLQREISPLVKAHYHMSHSTTLPLMFLRIFVMDSPYQSPKQTANVFTDSSRVIYVAFPDSCPYIYTSITASTGSKTAPSTASMATDTRTLQRLVRDSIPKALSRPHERFALKATSLAAKNLPTLLALRGPGRTTSSNGAFSIFADAAIEGSPLDPRPSNTVSPEEHICTSHSGNVEVKETTEGSTAKRQSSGLDPGPLSPESKKRRLTIYSRFGSSGSSLTPAPLDRLDIRLLDPPNCNGDQDNEDADDSTSTLPAVSLTFAGSDVVDGIRQLAELGIVDPERMPSWMTGEEGVSVATVRQGRCIQRNI